MSKTYTYIKIIIVIFCTFHLDAQEINFQSIASPIETLTEDDVVIKGIRLRNPDGQPVILVHGFMENTRTWRETAYKLYEQGHDVFMYNMRGHGNGEQRSHAIKGNHNKIYTFDNIVAYDIPSMIEHTYQQTGKKAYFIGHSMGTMSGRLSLSGVRKGPEGMYVDEAAIDWAKQRVKGAVALASPTTFKTKYYIYELIRLSPDSFLNLKRSLINTLIKKDAPYIESESGPLKRFFKKTSDHVVEYTSRLKIFKEIFNGVLKIDNLSDADRETTRLFYKGLTNPPLELIKDTQRWLANGYTSSDGKLNYEGLEIPKGLNYVYIGSGHDQLAHPADILKDMSFQKNQDKLLYAFYPDFSHVDLISGNKGGHEVARFINELIHKNFKYEQLEPKKSYQKMHLIRPKDLKAYLGRDECLSLIKRLMF